MSARCSGGDNGSLDGKPDQARFVLGMATADLPTRGSVALPEPWRGDLQQVAVRITEVDAHPAPPPLRAALEGDTGAPEVVLPRLQLVLVDGERYVHRAGDVRYVRASSGHIAGIINPPGGKGAYWTREIGDTAASSPEQWLQSAKRHEGSWWPDWTA